MNKIKKTAVALSVMLLLASAGFAGTVKSSTEEPNKEPLLVKYLGEDANYVFFRVSIKSGSNKLVSFAVSDKEEGELYSTVLSADKEQTYKIEKRENQELDFNLLVGSKNYSKSYSKSFTATAGTALEKL